MNTNLSSLIHKALNKKTMAIKFTKKKNQIIQGIKKNTNLRANADEPAN